MKRFLAVSGGSLALVLGAWAGSVETNKPALSPPPPREPLVVTSQHLQVDYAHNVGTFEGNVLAVDPQITVRADKMVVFFGVSTNQTAASTNQTAASNTTARTLERIIADGGVIITQQDKKARSEHAVYTAADGKAVLTGNPQVEGPEGTVTGEKIIFWRDQKKMDVESGTRLILYPEDKTVKPAAPQEPPP